MLWIMDGVLLSLENPHMRFVVYTVQKKVETDVNSPFGVPPEMMAIMQNRLLSKLIDVPIIHKKERYILTIEYLRR